MDKLEIHLLSALSDNYIYAIRETQSGTTGIIDPSEAEPVLSFLEEHQWKLDYIFNTHHHFDHTDGNLEVKKATQCRVVGAKFDQHRIPGIDVSLDDDETFAFGNLSIKTLQIFGHTLGHIAFWIPESFALFCGDTLFTLGCGRLFEGSPQQMWSSLLKLRRLPKNTRIYCGHEYTQKNAKFALTIDPTNEQLQDRALKVDALRMKNQPTVPATLELELATNPFLRADNDQIRQNLGLTEDDPLVVFSEIRKRRDRF